MYQVSQAWHIPPPEDLTGLQMLAGLEIHALYERKRREAEANHMRGIGA